MVREVGAWFSELAFKGELGVSASREWLEPNLFWRRYPFHFVKYEAYVVWHHHGFDLDPHVTRADDLAGYGAEIKFSLDVPPLLVVRFKWSDGTLQMEEFARDGTGPTVTHALASVLSATEAQAIVVKTLNAPGFWREQLDRFWGMEEDGGHDGPNDGGSEP